MFDADEDDGRFELVEWRWLLLYCRILVDVCTLIYMCVVTL